MRDLMTKIVAALGGEEVYDTDVWAILTALRGPDYLATDVVVLKEKYTNPIRCWVLGTTSAVPGLGLAVGDPPPTTVEGWKELLVTVRERMREGGYDEGEYHYLNHITQAIGAIVAIEASRRESQ